MVKKIILNGYNIHQGGGKVLLNQVVRLLHSAHILTRCYVDTRLKLSDTFQYSSIEFVQIPPTVINRLSAEREIQRLSSNYDLLINFGNLPPLFRPKCKVIVFVQNRYLLETEPIVDTNIKTKIKNFIEKSWLSYRGSNQYQYIVQTLTMKNLLKKFLGPQYHIEICGFYDLPVYPQDDSINVKDGFIYVAGLESHKNHQRLLQAWELLKNKYDLAPKLTLITSKAANPRMFDQYRNSNLNIEILGNFENSEVLKAYLGAQALVFPSLFESFGLPLLEAASLKLPIIAADRDYIRDIIEPTLLFDPLNSLSLAQQIKVFLETKELHEKCCPIKNIVPTQKFLNILGIKYEVHSH